MPRYFVDTFYLVALSDPRDQWHARVVTFSRSLSDYHLYTVDEVLAEYLTFYSASRPHIREDAVQTVLVDKHYSLTDCVSMQAMRREGLTDVLTNDHHFTQEGFHILFP